MAIIPDAVAIENVSDFYKNDLGVTVSVLRLDKIDPIISGNKYFKLKYNLEAAISGGYGQIITFGGAYSNHLIATASAANASGLKSIGIVRGLHARDHSTPTLKACEGFGMQLQFVSRENYNLKNDPEYLAHLTETFGKSFIIPEGGDNDLGRKGTEDITTLIPDVFTHVCLPVGTGTTFSGIRNSLPPSKKMIGFTAMKDGKYLAEEIEKHLSKEQNINWQLDDRFHFGGFAKTTDELINFMRSFYQSTNMPLDIVYTGKMMFGIDALLKENAFPNGSNVLAIHTGGLQGNPDGLFQQ